MECPRDVTRGMVTQGRRDMLCENLTVSLRRWAVKVPSYLVAIFLAVTGVALSACAGAGAGGNDTLAFGEISRADIAALDSELSDASIPVTNADGLLLPPGSIVLYSTRSGLYGKLRVESYNPSGLKTLTVDVVTYAGDGTVDADADNLTIRGTYSADLETPAEVAGLIDVDVFWSNDTLTDSTFVPQNAARFAVYSIP